MEQQLFSLSAIAFGTILTAAAALGRSGERDAADVAALDTQYQAAVERNVSDTYVRTGSGWRYVFGQASLALPKP